MGNLVGSKVIMKGNEYKHRVPSLRKTNFLDWEAYQLNNEYITLILLPQVGGRIISLKFNGQEVFYQLPEARGRVYQLPGVKDIKKYRQQQEYTPIGGYKTWLAPQLKWGWPPYLDLEIGQYQMEDYSDDSTLEVNMISPICRETGIRLSRKIKLEAGRQHMEIDQGMENCSNIEQEFALWDVTQICGKGEVIFPIGTEDRLVSLGQNDVSCFYSFINCKEAKQVKVNCNGLNEFKLGTPYTEGWVLTKLSGEDNKELIYLKEFPLFKESSFGHGCAIEVYDTDRFSYFEVEVQGPLIKLMPGQKYSFKETWYFT